MSRFDRLVAEPGGDDGSPCLADEVLPLSDSLKERSIPLRVADLVRLLGDDGTLDAAERALRDLDERRRKEEIALRRRQAALQAEGDKAESGYLEERQKASAALVAAREAYRKAGGRD